MSFNDPITIIMLAVLVLLIFFMFRNSRKRQRDAAALRDKIKVGAEVMTNFGLFGKLLSIDEEENQVLIETSPGVTLRLHRGTVTRVVEPKTPAEVPAQAELNDDHGSLNGEPEYGERVDDSGDTPDTPRTSGDE